MESAEGASASSSGPRYAPDDPMLPNPWKGLIDGSTLYYWNPETNVTQYDKPVTTSLLPPGPPLSSGPLPTASTPMVGITPVPVSGTLTSSGSSMPVQNSQLFPYQSQSVVNQQTQQQYPQLQSQQFQFPLVSYLQGQQTQQQGTQVPYQQQGPQVSYQQQPQLQNPQFLYPQLPQQPQQPQQLQQLQQPQPPQQQQNSQTSFQQQQQHQGSLVPYQQQQQSQMSNIPFQMGQQPQGSRASYLQGQQQLESKQTDAYQQGKQPQGQQIGVFRMGESLQQETSLMPSNEQLSGVTAPVQVSQIQFNSIQQQQPPSTSQQFGGPSSTSQQLGGPPSRFTGLSSSSQQLSGPSFGTDTNHQQEKNMGINHERQSVARSMGLQPGYVEGQRERSGNEFNSYRRNERLMLPAQQPKLALLPQPQERKPQDLRMGGSDDSPHFVSMGHSPGLNLAPANAVSNFYDHPPFPSVAHMRPPQRMLGTSEFAKIAPTDAYRRQHEIIAMGDNIPPPFMTFEATGFPPEILREMHLAGFVSPTPIQAQTWPVALQSRDIVAIAKTGSGKTLGYLVPAFIHLRRTHHDPQFGPSVLVLAPTRELATQIQDEAVKFGRSSRISCICVYGGAPKGPQLRDIEQGADIVVATPGRLNDILEMRKINLHHVSFLVLDEADRMLDMGFEPQIRKIVDELSQCRQTLMYTATWPKEVRKIAGDLLVDPVQVNIGSIDELAANKSITQYVEMIPPMDKQRRLEQILRSQERGTKIIIFCSTKRLCDQLARSIDRQFGAASIHGDKSQDERNYALNQFRCGKMPILVATDVAARGIDVKDIRVVVNYDFPTSIEDYVHRIGRTGRAGATGISYTFLSEQDWKYAGDLVKVLEGANQHVPPEVREMAARGGPLFSRNLPHGGMGRFESGSSPFGGRGSGRWGTGSDRSGGGRWDPSGGCGGGGSGMRDFGGGRGRGGGMRDFGGGRSGGRNDFYDGRGSMRGRGIGGPGGGWGRHDRGPQDRYYNSHPDGRGRLDASGRRGYTERGRGRSRSRSRSWSRSPSRSRSRSWGRSRSRSRSRSLDYKRPPRRRGTLFTDGPGLPVEGGNEAPRVEATPVTGINDVPVGGQLPTVSPGQDNGLMRRNEITNQADGLLPGNEMTNQAGIAEQNLEFAALEPKTGLEAEQQEAGGGRGEL